jgi:N-glycosidase YbiA
MTIKIFNPRKKPFGMLSNNAAFPMEIDGKKYKSVTHYIYSQLLCKGTYQNLVRNQKNSLSAVSTYNNVHIDCEKINVTEALEKVYTEKVKNDTLFRNLLLQTGQKKLIYQSDNEIIGMEAGNGSNLIGKMLEKVRHKLLSDEMMNNKKEEEKQKDEDIYKIYMVVEALDNLMKIQENNLKEYENMTYHEILNEGNLIDKQYSPKNIILENYHKGRLQHRNIIETILKHGSTRQIAKYFRKYNIRDLYDRLKKRKKNLIVDYYLRDLVLSHYPALPSENEIIREAINQQMRKLNQAQINEQRHNISLKYYNNKIKFINNDLQEELRKKIEKIEQKIPTIEEVEDAENFVFDQMYEEQQNYNKQEPEAVEVKSSPVIHQSKQLAMFLENLDGNVQGDDENIGQIDLDINKDDETFENETEIVFDKNIDGKYGMFSPLYQSWILLNNLFYPTVAHYLYANKFKNIIQKIKHNKKAWILAHNLITLNEINEDQYYTKNPDFYVKIDIFNWRQHEKELICRAKKDLFAIAAHAKFFFYNMQQLLYLTGKQHIIYADKGDSCLGIGEIENGENYTGKWLETKRSEISQEIANDAKNNADIILLGQMLNNDTKLNNWIFERAKDIVHTLVLTSNGFNISEQNVDFVIEKIYFPCNGLEISNVDIHVPDSFKKRINDYLHDYIKEYSLVQQIDISIDGISKIWKYVSLLSYNLLREANKQGVLPYIYLSDIQHELSNSCKIDSIRCIISAIENIRNILESITLNHSIETVIGGIIYGKQLKIVKSKNKKVLSEFENKKLSDLCYTLLQKIRQQNGHRVSNRINFFKSLEPIFIQKNEDMFTDIVQSEKQQQDDILAFLEM